MFITRNFFAFNKLWHIRNENLYDYAIRLYHKLITTSISLYQVVRFSASRDKQKFCLLLRYLFQKIIQNLVNNSELLNHIALAIIDEIFFVVINRFERGML